MYKRIFKEAHYKELFKYRDRKIIDIEHSIDRFNQRFPQFELSDFIKTIQDGIDIILDVFKDSKNKYIIISKSKQIGVQLDWRKDNKNIHDIRNHGYTSTTLDYKSQKNAIKGDTKLFVEDFKKYNVEEWFNNNDYKNILKEIGYYAIELQECPDYRIYAQQGQINKNFTVIEVK